MSDEAAPVEKAEAAALELDAVPEPVADAEALVGDAVVAVLATLATLAADEEAAARRLMGVSECCL